MILLDTHAWLWFISSPEFLSKKARKAVDGAVKEKAVLISSISTWQVAMLVSKNRVTLTMETADWVGKSEALPFFRFIPVDNAIALKAVSLPQPIHPDPADRIIIATAMSMGVSLITKDEKIRGYRHVGTIW